MSSRRSYAPDRGDLVWLNFTPQAGRQPSGRRPALIVSPRAYNRKVGLAICCPITSQIKGYPFEVVLPEGGLVTGAVLADHVKNLDWRARRAEFKARVPAEILDEVLGKISTLLSG